MKLEQQPQHCTVSLNFCCDITALAAALHGAAGVCASVVLVLRLGLKGSAGSSCPKQRKQLLGSRCMKSVEYRQLNHSTSSCVSPASVAQLARFHSACNLRGLRGCLARAPVVCLLRSVMLLTNPTRIALGTTKPNHSLPSTHSHQQQHFCAYCFSTTAVGSSSHSAAAVHHTQHTAP